jgi:signal transduction histidine kinase/ABC-type sugar transport system substrate-binding protein/AraC-like DNA-binding protein/DNA-binding response OmpR family regulator
VSRTLRIGARIGSADPFWVQTREAVLQRAQQLAIDLVSIDISFRSELSVEQEIAFVEDLLAQELNALICSYLPDRLVGRVLEHGIPVIHLTEADRRHPLFVAAYGFYDIAQMVARYLADQLAEHGNILVVGGLLAREGEDGKSRIAGFYDALRDYPNINLQHIPTAWRYERAYPQIEAALRQCRRPIDAMYGLSDSVALAARDAGLALGVITKRTRIVGINGDPLALSAIADGSMLATVETSAAEFGIQAVDLASQAARGQPLPAHFGYQPRLVTAENVSEVAMQKLIAIAELPSRLVGVNREQERQRLIQLETSLEINRRVGSILNRQKLNYEIADLIRANYGYDTVQLFLWLEAEQALVLDEPNGTRIPLAASGLLGQALTHNEPIFVPDTHHSQRFPPDPAWPATRSRVVVPIRLGGAILGVLDLHSRGPTQLTRQSLAGLQVLADQLGIAMRNAELYSDALKALAIAEKADQLKTRLLANVSHELRTPLNVILGYSQSALASPNPYNTELPAGLLHDLGHIYHSGEHLIRLINDLLDLSRAEIDQLELFPETIATRAFLEDVFQSITTGLKLQSGVECRLSIPARLPLIYGDPVRLRQILFNLLSNACKFTDRGQIILGAEVAPPHLHIWVEDTGMGIAGDLQEQIFEPFVTEKHGDRQLGGVGLGLAITRRLVALHRGMISLDSQLGRGSTFHIYLPLPNLGGQPASVPTADRQSLLLIAAHHEPTATIADLCARMGLTLYRAEPADDLQALLATVQPAALAWDLGQTDSTDWQLLRQLCGDNQTSQLPLILYGQESTVDSNEPIGMTGILSKPLNRATLLEAINSLHPTADNVSILVVDDDAQTRELYQSIVAQALPGWRIRDADGGAAALEMLAQEVPGLVILDLMMPDIDGFAVLDHLRSHQHLRQVPVIILSGRTLSYQDIKRIDHPFVTFQSKDILSWDEIATTLHAALAGGDQLAQPTSLLVKRAIAYIQQHHARDLSRQEIAEAVGVSKNYITQIFHQELGISLWDYLTRYRIMRAKELLRGTDESITTIAEQVGFDDASYFGRVFRKQAGCSPQAYRDHNI